MAAPLFCVDLSDDARDYRQTALEPGLPLLDRQGSHFEILRGWLGDYVAEPEWIDEHVVAFYGSTGSADVLEDVTCQPLTKAELEKQFAGDLRIIRDRVQRAKADSPTARLVLRTLKKSLAEQASGPNGGGCDSYFFKCRAGNEAWRLVWCCGYQRADLEPLPAQIWHTPDGEFLAVHPLAGVPITRRKRRGPRWTWACAGRPCCSCCWWADSPSRRGRRSWLRPPVGPVRQAAASPSESKIVAGGSLSARSRPGSWPSRTTENRRLRAAPHGGHAKSEGVA